MLLQYKNLIFSMGFFVEKGNVDFIRQLIILLSLQNMEAIQIRGIFKDAICRAIPIEENLYRITKDTVFIGTILNENGGWCLEEVSGEDLTAENVQLIGAYLDRKRR